MEGARLTTSQTKMVAKLFISEPWQLFSSIKPLQVSVISISVRRLIDREDAYAGSARWETLTCEHWDRRPAEVSEIYHSWLGYPVNYRPDIPAGAGAGGAGASAGLDLV